MKKAFYFVAIATLFMFSCQKELDTTQDSAKKGFTFKASIEQLDAKANINADNALVWATGDKIGIYVNDDSWTDKNQPFTLSSGEGTTQGEFTWDYSGNFSQNAAAAFFPWQGTGSDKNNVANGNVYFKLPGAYDNPKYTSGQMLTPLVASLNGSTDDIKFKHAGAAVKVTINNLPAGVHSLGMTVAGQQVYGDYQVSISDAGNAAMVPEGTADNTKNSLWLNIEPVDAEREFVFLFPVPELTTPKLSFNMYDENNILVWKKNLKAQSSNLGRGDVLEMPAIDIEPYVKFNTVSEEWTVIGILNGTNWNADIPMITDGTICIAKGVSFAAGGVFKVRQNKSWESPNASYPENNYVVNDAGTYDIIFDTSDNSVRAVVSKCPYPSVPVEIGIDGDMSEWANVPGLVLDPTSSAAIEQVKAYADEDNIYVYVRRSSLGRYSDIWSTSGGYYYLFFDLDNDPTTGTQSHNYGGSDNKYEAFCYVFPFSSTEGTFVSPPNPHGAGMTVSGVTCAGVYTSSYTDVEIAIPRDNFPNITSETIGVRVYGSKDAGLTPELSFEIEREHHEIKIDGDMSDWSKVGGATTTGIIKALKMWNDDTNFYFYNSCEPGARGSELWNGGGYYYYDFNLDNNAETGDYSEGSHGPFEATICIFPFAGTAEAPAIDIVKFYLEQGVTTDGITLKGAIADDLIEVEFVIPRANFTTQVQSGDVITVYNWRAKDGNSTTLTYTVQ